jgi:hypothetical protein
MQTSFQPTLSEACLQLAYKPQLPPRLKEAVTSCKKFVVILKEALSDPYVQESLKELSENLKNLEEIAKTLDSQSKT